MAPPFSIGVINLNALNEEITLDYKKQQMSVIYSTFTTLLLAKTIQTLNHSYK